MSTPLPLRSRYLAREPARHARIRLLCFHHAGGGASAYAGWHQGLGDDVAVVPVQLPGRETRNSEPRFRTMEPLIDELVAELDGVLDQPFALYGHSMGALVAYNLARRLHRTGGPLPEVLLVGAYPAPHRPPALGELPDLPDDELTRVLLDLGGMSESILAYPEWLTAALDTVRDDLRVCRSHDRGFLPRLPFPIEVFTGRSDPLMQGAEPERWLDHTRAGFRVHRLPGGHFFTRQSTGELLALLRGSLGDALAPARRSTAS
ncbi:thioesterase II family protein [Kitasatospora purpeofusca]|uniref:thioesterase II family protein n=1 Tax=Kitasatospora purpeofusca TaxID=67352 RepID=UPI0036D2AE93